VLLVGVVSTTLGILLGQLDEKCFSLVFDNSASVLFPLVEVNDSIIDACLRAAYKSLGF